MSIHDMLQKINRVIGGSQSLVFMLAIIIVGFSAFGLGRLSVQPALSNNQVVEIKNNTIEKMDNTISSRSLPASVAESVNDKSMSVDKKGKYVASKNGKLYYAVGCPGIKRIKEENKVWFDVASDAEKLGYTMSASCHK